MLVHLFVEFNINWAFGNSYEENVLQLLMGPSLKSASNYIWINVIKAIRRNCGWNEIKEFFGAKHFNGGTVVSQQKFQLLLGALSLKSSRIIEYMINWTSFLQLNG